MRSAFEVTQPELIHAVLDSASYGTLALSCGERPYAVAVNFVRMGEEICFHGAQRNRKMQILAQNPLVSFSVVESYSLIDSHFSSTDMLACPATHFFKSVTIEGEAKPVESREEKAKIFTALMQKLQPSGGYRPFSDKAYDKALAATAVVKIVPEHISCKFKFGQNLNRERFERVVAHLLERGSALDKKSAALMQQMRGG